MPLYIHAHAFAEIQIAFRYESPKEKAELASVPILLTRSAYFSAYN